MVVHLSKEGDTWEFWLVLQSTSDFLLTWVNFLYPLNLAWPDSFLHLTYSDFFLYPTRPNSFFLLLQFVQLRILAFTSVNFWFPFNLAKFSNLLNSAWPNFFLYPTQPDLCSSTQVNLNIHFSLTRPNFSNAFLYLTWPDSFFCCNLFNSSLHTSQPNLNPSVWWLNSSFYSTWFSFDTWICTEFISGPKKEVKLW